jgi:16S rRNA processing protein RimM
MFDGNELCEIAYVVKSHGLKGHLSLRVQDDISNNIITEDMPVFLEIDGIPVPFLLESVKFSGNNSIIKLRHVDSSDHADRFKSCKVLIIEPKSIIEEEYESDFELLNYMVFDKTHGYIGIICDFNEIPGNPVFEINFNEKIIIIPYVDEFIESINHDKKTVNIVTPIGLVDLYL